MILPIVAYGDPVLRQKCAEITPDYPELDVLIENMFATMYHASGVGLAAPQIGLNNPAVPGNTVCPPICWAVCLKPWAKNR